MGKKKKQIQKRILLASIVLVLSFACLFLVFLPKMLHGKGEDGREDTGRTYLKSVSENDVRAAMNQIEDAKNENGDIFVETDEIVEAVEDTDPITEDVNQVIEENENAVVIVPTKEERIQALRNELEPLVNEGPDFSLLPEEIQHDQAGFSGHALIGDSMAQAAFEYEVLPQSSVFYRRGASVDAMGDVTADVVASYPNKLVFWKGLNDCNRFVTTDEFVDAYVSFIEDLRIKCQLEASDVYICSLLPGNKYINEARPDLARSPVFDEALQFMCQARGYHYVDTKWIGRADGFLEDGIHMKPYFYHIWLRYMAGYFEIVENE